MTKKSCEKVSVWETTNDRATTLVGARLFEYDEYYKVKINRGIAKNNNIDTDLEGWCICVSEDKDDGPHHHGEITDCFRGSTLAVKFPKPHPQTLQLGVPP